MSNITAEHDVDFTEVAECDGPCAEVYRVKDLENVAGSFLCPNCKYEHPEVVRALYEDLRADMLSDDY